MNQQKSRREAPSMLPQRPNFVLTKLVKKPVSFLIDKIRAPVTYFVLRHIKNMKETY